MHKSKLLFFIHVPWKWIKQRPHFIAEELSKDNDVTVAEWLPWEKKYRSKGKQTVNLKSYFQLPKDRIPVVHFLNSLLQKIKLGKYIKKADIVWFTNPVQYTFYKRENIKGQIVYDCMDDLPEFEPTEERRKLLEEQERILYGDADVVIASSSYLKNKLTNRYGDRDIHVVNNAIKEMDEKPLLPLPDEIKGKMPEGHFLLTYIGTIEKWLDSELLLSLVEQYTNVAVCLFGPLKIELPKHERIVYCGMVPHDLVFSVMEHSDALIMPFVLNELILSVNPVKLYEYIYSGKPCLAPRYGESEVFEDFVYLYKNSEECNSIIGSLVEGKGAKHSKEDSRSFAMSNTWYDRVKEIEKILK